MSKRPWNKGYSRHSGNTPEPMRIKLFESEKKRQKTINKKNNPKSLY
jgi:hypothetical protein